ncbi:MAG: hypothetical protein R6U98_09235 [Pirellulaceae bacterium]
MKHTLLLLAIMSMGAVGCQTHGQFSDPSCQSGQPSGYGQYAGRSGGATLGGGGAACLPRNSPDYVPRIPQGSPQGSPQVAQPAGPAAATANYPYYTNRAPRDFLLDEPSTIGY